MKIAIYLFFLVSFSLSAKNCENIEAVNKFFLSLENDYKLNELDEVVLYGRDLKSGNTYKLIFDRSDPFSNSPGEFKTGSYVIKSADHRFLNGELIVTGGLFDGYSRYGKIKSSVHTRYLESEISAFESTKFHYNKNGKLIKFSYFNKKTSQEITFFPSQRKALESSY